MKIRTSFVTNSSSYSSAEIKINNPVLLAILKKYAEKGAFINSMGDDIGEWIIEEKEIHYSNEETADVFFAPKSIEEVADAILTVIRDYLESTEMENEEAFKECEKEIKDRSEEIIKGYVKVKWVAENLGMGECEPDEGEQTKWKFNYSRNTRKQ